MKPLIKNSDKAVEPVLKVEDLKTYFYTEDGVVKAVDGVDFEVFPGEVLGLVGESGCGKSVTSLSIMRLVDSPGKIEAGTVLFEGKNILDLPMHEMTAVRGKFRRAPPTVRSSAFAKRASSTRAPTSVATRSWR